jgi:uncharacterized protein YlxW (UPF0749 family)
MRYAYFSFILIFIMMVAFCASCSDNTTQHRRLHEIEHTSQSKHTTEKNTLLHSKNTLKQENHQLKHHIKNIHFD